MDTKRLAVERALVHHGIRYMVRIGDGKFVISTGTGRRAMDIREAEAYCLGLADKERAMGRAQSRHPAHLYDQDAPT